MILVVRLDGLLLHGVGLPERQVLDTLDLDHLDAALLGVQRRLEVRCDVLVLLRCGRHLQPPVFKVEVAAMRCLPRGRRVQGGNLIPHASDQTLHHMDVGRLRHGGREPSGRGAAVQRIGENRVEGGGSGRLVFSGLGGIFHERVVQDVAEGPILLVWMDLGDLDDLAFHCWQQAFVVGVDGGRQSGEGFDDIRPQIDGGILAANGPLVIGRCVGLRHVGKVQLVPESGVGVVDLLDLVGEIDVVHLVPLAFLPQLVGVLDLQRYLVSVSDKVGAWQPG
mmetsp:Transcript_2866/g.8052  ORF Transcript_2866/g.8052 Transcript_2866/m.8052 type:complete len:279 (-) Transcript_2866:1956-2792(-)